MAAVQGSDQKSNVMEIRRARKGGTATAKLISVELAFLIVLAMSSLLPSATPQSIFLHWIKSTSFQNATADYAAGIVHGKLIVAGGTYWEGVKHHWTKKIFSSATYSFDPVTHKWNRCADMPMPLGYPASTTVGNTLFVLGGYNGRRVSRKIFTLNKRQNKYVWKVFGELPVDRIFGQAVAIGNDIYLVGGSAEFEPLDAIGTCCTSKTATNALLVLDTNHPGKGWRELPPYPGAARWLFTTETDGKSIWMFGGQYQASPKDPIQHYPEVLRFNPADGRWRVVALLPVDLRNTPWVSPVFANGRMILISSTKKIWQLDLKTLTYTELSPLPEAVEVDRFVWLKNRVIGSGGENINDEGSRRRSDSTFIGYFGPD